MELDLLALVSRVLHILAAITAVGGTIFARFALVPSLAEMAEEKRRELHAAIRSRWAKWVMISIGFLLLSGLYNIMRIELAGVPKPISAPYHALFGVKFLLALAIFFIASALVGRSEGLQKMRDNARLWLSVNVGLSVLLVCISGTLRVLRDGNPRPAPPPAAAADTPLAE